MANQKEGVFAAVVSVVGEVNGKVELSDSQKKEVVAVLFREFRAGNIEYKGGAPKDDAVLSKYIPGLLNNWMRKDTRLNGGGAYVTKNPGSRAGSGDESLKAMRGLLAITTDPSVRTQILAAIEERQLELKPKTEIKVAALPPSLRKYAPTLSE